MYQSGCEPEDTCAGLYGPNSQTGLICARPPSAAQHAEDDEEEAAGLGRVRREDPLAADGVLGASRAGELGVLLPHDQREVGADQRQQDRRDQQHVHDVEPADDHVAGERPAEDQERRPRCRRTGIDSMIASAMRRPVPESRSSGSE